VSSRAFGALIRRELIRWSRARIAIYSGLIMPLVYLLLFGQALNLGKLIPIPPGESSADLLPTYFLGAPDYYSYFSVGMVAFVVVFSSLFIGATLIFDQRLGVIKKSLAAPIRRSYIFSARLIGGMVQPLLLAAVVFFLALLFNHIPGLSGLTVTAQITVASVFEIAFAVISLGVLFASIFLAIGFVVTDPQSYFGLINLVNLPILFTSNALFPVYTMPPWLQTVSAYNPVSLAVNVMRLNLFDSASYYAYSSLVYLGALLAVTAVVFVLSLLLARRGLTPH
jgi:ABC-2 type transport system permease protein